MASGPMLGVIGGSGLYDFADLGGREVVEVQTPYGPPSDPIVTGTLGGTPVAFIARHGAGHRHSPTDLPYRANIYTLKLLGVTHVVSVSAVGSLHEGLPPRSVVLPDQVIDRTVNRPRSFFEGGAVAHVGIADAFCPRLRSALASAIAAAEAEGRYDGTYVCIEGPQFSTRAESVLHRSWGATVVGMTAMPEARLAREAELCYATVAMVTDYDVWREEEEAVSVELVAGHLHANAELGRKVVRNLSAAGLPERSCDCGDALRHAILTPAERIPSATRRRLGLIADRYLPPAPETDA